MDELDAALARLAAELAVAERGEPGGCTFCWTEDELVLLAGPVDLVPDELLPRIAMEPYDHREDYPRFFRRFLPRILARLVHDELHVDEDMVADRLRVTGCWTDWTGADRQLVLDVLWAWWRATITTAGRQPHVAAVAAVVATTPVPLGEWLAAFSAEHGPAADQQFARLLADWGPELASGPLEVGWGTDVDITETARWWLLAEAPERLARLDDPHLAEQVRHLG